MFHLPNQGHLMFRFGENDSDSVLIRTSYNGSDAIEKVLTTRIATPSVKHEDIEVNQTLRAGELNQVTFYPTICNENNFVNISLLGAYPHSTWMNALVSVGSTPAWNVLDLVTSTTQEYTIWARFLYCIY